MFKKIIFSLVLSFVCLSAPGSEKEPDMLFTPITTQNGLANNKIRAVKQLPDGRMVFVSRGLINIYDGSNFTYLHYSKQQPYELRNYSGHHRIYTEDDGNIWLKDNHKLMLFDISEEEMVPDLEKFFHEKKIPLPVIDFFLTNHDTYWVLTDNYRLISYNTKTGKSERFANLNLEEFYNRKDPLYDLSIVGQKIYLFFKSGATVCYDIDNHNEEFQINPLSSYSSNPYGSTLLAVAHPPYIYQLRTGQKGSNLLRFNVNNRKWDNLLSSPTTLNTLTIDKTGLIWVSSSKGLYRISPDNLKVRYIPSVELTSGHQYETEISTQFHDRNGGLWIGTADRGLLYYHEDRFKFNYHGKSEFLSTLSSDLNVKCITASDSLIYFGTNHGLFYSSANNLANINLYPGLPEDLNCTDLIKDHTGCIWLSTLDDGVFCIEKEHITRYPFPQTAFTVYETFDHQYFSGTPGGISVFNEKKEIWETPISATNSVYSLKHFSNDTLWGLSGAGLFKYCLPEEKMSLISKKPLNNSNILINDFIVDTKGLKWIGTQDGLFLYNQNFELIKDFYAADGLVNNTIKSIIEDKEKKIWVATANGISCFEVTATNGEYEFAINNFNHFDGLMKDELLAGSVAQLPEGTMVWGGVDGINTVNPAELDGNEQHLLKPLFVNFYLAGIKVKQNQTFGNDTLLDKSITSTNRIKLDHNQNYVGFEVSACHYQNPGKTYYQYKMDGVDDSWRIMHPDKHTAFINYTNLSPGEYTLKVKASGIPHQWPDEYSSIEVIIQPPFYQTPWAYFTYLIVVLMMVIGVSVYIIRKNKQKSRRRQKTEIENLKQNFFINLSHDLKTPLTLILTPLESVLNNLEQNELKTKLSKIYYNANNLLQLVNQLLNFRKLEVYGDTLNLKYTPVGELIDSVVFGFKESSLTAETQFSYHNTLNELHAYVDKDKLVSIIYNLLTNAFKYTNQKVEISAILNEQSQISITISDDGCGIPQKERSRIFSRYYRMEKHHNSHSGTGIGLHVVKQYVELHEGRLMVDSSPDRGSSFTVLIPADMKTDNEILDVHNETSDSGRGQQILIIEDNNEFRDFLVNELSARYSVKAAVNGGDALKLLSGYHPDLIISDFFMPEMGGLEFCKRQKSNIQNSHIPVIIISAGSSEQMQIDCFSAGADAYITKPFNMNVLLARINNLLDQQRERQLLFRRSNVVQPGELTNSKIDKDLIKKAIDFIDNNLENPSFSVDLLSRELCMDRTGLYRKIKAITGQTPSDFIKVIRLKRASVLLEQGMSVSEVSVKVGFSSNSYFSKCFQAQFGIKPSKWEEQNLT